MSNGLLVPVSALMILGLANVRGWLAHLLSLKYMVILGEASYAIYLLHVPIWLYFASVHPIDTAIAWVIYAVIVVAAGIASFFLMEQPAKKKILSLAANWRSDRQRYSLER
jgi:peptidoglycan/LPS O-acetylase OafA/YrhL